MEDNKLVSLAREYCRHFHKGQFRKTSNLPYHTHPEAVADILDKNGYSDTATLCIALLHDIVEDTKVDIREIQERFGYEIANGVYVLSKNTIYDETADLLNRCLPSDVSGLSEDDLYKARLCFARNKIKRVKIADMIHNTSTLIQMEKPESIERKIYDAKSFYIPMGEVIAPLMVKELENNIRTYLTLVSLKDQSQQRKDLERITDELS